MLSPFGPAEQLHGGSRLISASSFWMRLALDDSCEPFIMVLPHHQGPRALPQRLSERAGFR